MKRIWLAGGVLSLVVAVSPVLAGPKGEHAGKMGHGAMAEKMADELNLSTEQRAKMKDLHAAQQQEMAPIHEEMKKKHAEMEQLFAAATLDEAAIMAKAGELAAVQAQMHTSMIKMRIAMHQIMTPEQRVKAADLMKKHQEKRAAMMKEHGGEMMEPGAGFGME